MELLNTLVSAVNNVLWSYVLIVMLVGLGLWFSFRTGFVQIRHLREMVRLVAEGATAKTKKGHISTFQALLRFHGVARVGVGNNIAALPLPLWSAVRVPSSGCGS